MTARVAAALLCLCAVAATARAAPPEYGPILVLEAHAGDRPKELDRIFERLHGELEDRGFAARPATLAKLVGGRAPWPGIRDRGTTAAEILARADRGYDAFARAKFAQAVEQLAPAIELIERNPALFVTDPGHTGGVVNAYVALSLSQSRLGRPDQAMATMAELVRVFPRAISRVEHGPEAEGFARTVRDALEKIPRGRLTIDPGSARAMVFVDRQWRGTGRVTLPDLVPGTYRVLVQEPGTDGRQYTAEVRGGTATELDVPWDVDTIVAFTDRWVGLELPTERARTREGLLAASLAARWSSRSQVVVLGLARRQGKPAVVATIYDREGGVVRCALALVDDRAADRLPALARYLADGTGADTIAALARPPHILDGMPMPRLRRRDLPPPPSPQTAEVAHDDGPPWGPIVAIGGGVGVLAGIGMIAVDDDVTYQNTTRFGIASAIAGAVAIGAGTWLWLRSRARRTGRVQLSVHAGGASCGWAAAF